MKGWSVEVKHADGAAATAAMRGHSSGCRVEPGVEKALSQTPAIGSVTESCSSLRCADI